MKQGPWWWDWGALKPSKDGSDYSSPEHRTEFLGETVIETQSTRLASPTKKTVPLSGEEEQPLEPRLPLSAQGTAQVVPSSC